MLPANIKKLPLLFCFDPSLNMGQLVRVVNRNRATKTAAVITAAGRPATVPLSWFLVPLATPWRTHMQL